MRFRVKVQDECVDDYICTPEHIGDHKRSHTYLMCTDEEAELFPIDRLSAIIYYYTMWGADRIIIEPVMD